MRNVIILGSGCAGNTAAIYTARAGLKPLVMMGHEPGGQLSLTTDVENFPGFPEGINGPDLVENMKKQAENSAPNSNAGTVTEADLSGSHFRVNVEGEWLETRTLIIASGASARWLGLPNEQKLIGHGVSSCATCDGFFYSERKIMVIGGGDSAMEEANFLTRFGSEVTLVHRRDQFRASKIMLDRARNNPEDQIPDQHRRGRCLRRLAKPGHRRETAQPEDRRSMGSGSGRLLPRHRPHPQHQALRQARSISMPTATSFPTAAPEPTSPASSTPATCRIAPIARPSPPPARAAWPP